MFGYLTCVSSVYGKEVMVKNTKMAAILDAILDFEECQQGISGDFSSVILHIFLDLSWKNQLVTKNVHLLGSMS